jgi:hypothetical protein
MEFSRKGEGAICVAAEYDLVFSDGSFSTLCVFVSTLVTFSRALNHNQYGRTFKVCTLIR